MKSHTHNITFYFPHEAVSQQYPCWVKPFDGTGIEFQYVVDEEISIRLERDLTKRAFYYEREGIKCIANLLHPEAFSGIWNEGGEEYVFTILPRNW